MYAQYDRYLRSPRVPVASTLVMALPILIACANVPEQESDATKAPKITESAAPTKPALAPDEALARVLGKMEAVGRNAGTEFEREEAEFLRRDDALSLLTSAYTSAKHDPAGRTTRWKAVYLISQIRASGAVAMLEQVALSKDSDFSDPPGIGEASPDAQDEALHAHDQPSMTDLPARITAAFALAQSVAAGVPGAGPALERVLSQAELEVARIAAVELFSQGALTDSQRAILNERGIFTNFRKYTDAEFDELRRIDPSELPRRDGKPAEHGEPPAATD